MQVSAAILCDYASVRDGLLFVTAGGIKRVWRSEYPAPLGVALGLLFEVHPMEMAHPHEVHVQIMGPDGEQVMMAQGAFQAGADLEVGESLTIPMAMDLRGVTLPREGAYMLNISIDGTHHRTLEFWVRPRLETGEETPLPPA